jgi:hypothetical protein
MVTYSLYVYIFSDFTHSSLQSSVGGCREAPPPNIVPAPGGALAPGSKGLLLEPSLHVVPLLGGAPGALSVLHISVMLCWNH